MDLKEETRNVFIKIHLWQGNFLGMDARDPIFKEGT